MNTLDLSPEYRAMVERELEPGENVEWIGRASGKYVQKYFWPAFILGLFLIVLGAFVQHTAMKGTQEGRVLGIIFSVTLTTFGLLIFCANLLRRRRTLHTLYIRTDRRALIIRPGRRVTVRTYPPKNLKNTFRREKQGDTGDLVFSVNEHAGDESDFHEEYGFMGIDNPRQVEERVLALANSLPADPQACRRILEAEGQEIEPDVLEASRERIMAELDEGEQVFWIGRPRPTPWAAHAGMSLFGGCIAFPIGCFCLLVGCIALISIIINHEALTAAIILMPFGLLFTPIGGLQLARPLISRAYSRRSVYAITDRRAITIHDDWPYAVIRSYRPEMLEEIYRNDRRNGEGDIRVIWQQWEDYFNKYDAEDLGFLRLKNPRKVERKLRLLAGNFPIK